MAQETSKCTLLKLPAELHLAILRFLRPRDVLRFGMCCKELLDIARSDDVWRDRVQNIVRNHLVAPDAESWTPSADVYSTHVQSLLKSSARYLGWWASTAAYRGRLFRMSLRQRRNGTLMIMGESIECRNGYVNSAGGDQPLPWKPEAAIWHGQLAYMLPENHPSPDAGYSVDVLDPVLEYKPLFYTSFSHGYTFSSLVGTAHPNDPIPYLPIYPVLEVSFQRKLRDSPASSERYPHRQANEEPSFPSKDALRAGVLRAIDEWGQPVENLQDPGGYLLRGDTLTAPAFCLQDTDPDGEEEDEEYGSDEEDPYGVSSDSGGFTNAARRYLYHSRFETALPLKMRKALFGSSDISEEEPEAFYPIVGPALAAHIPTSTPPDKPFLASDLQGMFVGCYASHGFEFGRISLRNVWTRLHTADEVALEQIYDEDPDQHNADPSVAREPLAPGLEGSVKRRRSILEFVKITGDVNVPAGQVSWLAILPSQTSERRPATDMQQYLQDQPDPDLDALVLPTVMRSDWETWSNIPPTLARQQYAGTVTPRWSEGCVQAAGRIAYNGFMDTRFIDAQATFIREADGQVDEVRIRWPELGKVSCYRRCKV